MPRECHKRVRRPTCACQYRPSVVMPVDDEVRVSQEANYESDEQSRYGGRILHEKPARRIRSIAECMEETPYLPEDF